jgi:hypothetical protein
MQKPAFATRLFAFVAPVACAIAFPAYVLVAGGEMTPLDVAAVARHDVASTTPILYGPAYTNINKPYKTFATLAAKPQVLVVGSSRTMQLRASLFPEGVSFYNAGGTVSHVAHLKKLLARIPREGQPEVMFVGLDQWFFNPQTEATFEADWDAQVDAKSDVLGVFQQSWTKVYGDWWSGKFTVDKLRSAPAGAVGLGARIQETGFRNDGSYFYGPILRHPDDPTTDPDRAFAVSLSRARSGSTRFEFADDVDRQVVADLDAFLDAAHARNIHVVGFLTSYAPPVIAAMRASGRFGYLEKIAPAVLPLFQSRGFTFFDFTDLVPLGSNDAEFLDGVHASEFAHLRMFDRFLEGDPALSRWTNAAHMSAIRSASAGPLAIVERRFR